MTSLEELKAKKGNRRPSGQCAKCESPSILHVQITISDKTAAGQLGPRLGSSSRAMCEQHAMEVFNGINSLPKSNLAKRSNP